jgi:transposase-like protein
VDTTTAFRASSSSRPFYFRFALSYRDVEAMLAERGIDVSYTRIAKHSDIFSD